MVAATQNSTIHQNLQVSFFVKSLLWTLQVFIYTLKVPKQLFQTVLASSIVVSVEELIAGGYSIIFCDILPQFFFLKIQELFFLSSLRIIVYSYIFIRCFICRTVWSAYPFTEITLFSTSQVSRTLRNIFYACVIKHCFTCVTVW